MSRSIVQVAALVTLFTIAACNEPTHPPHQIVLQAVTPLSAQGVVGARVDPVPSVIALDENGTAIVGLTISFTATGGGTIEKATAITDASGSASVGGWTLGTHSGTQTITARSVGLTEVVFVANAVPGPVALLTSISGQNQVATGGSLVPNQLRVLLSDAFGNPVSGAAVTFEILSGGGILEGENVTTALDGVAVSPPWRLGTVPGTQRVRARAGNLEVVFTAAAITQGAPSPWILFVRDDQIYSWDLASQVTTQITFFDKHSYPALSPDGRQIAFVSFTPDWIADIYLMDVDGSNVSRLTFGANFSFPAWSPAGQTLAVATNRLPYRGDIYLLSVDVQASPKQIANDASMPAWSPDGQRIAYVSLSGDDGYHALYLANPDGSAVKVIVPRAPHGIDHPVWSPDGSQIAFSECDSGKCDVEVVTRDGVLVWKTAIGNASWPVWSSDGRWLALTVGFAAAARVAYTDAATGTALTFIADGHTW